MIVIPAIEMVGRTLTERLAVSVAFAAARGVKADRFRFNTVEYTYAVMFSAHDPLLRWQKEDSALQFMMGGSWYPIEHAADGPSGLFLGSEHVAETGTPFT